MDEVFRVETQKKFRENEVPPAERKLQLKKANPWFGQKFSVFAKWIELCLVDIQNSRKQVNLIANCISTFDCDTALLLPDIDSLTKHK